MSDTKGPDSSRDIELDIPIVDISAFLSKDPAQAEQAKKDSRTIAELLHKYGVLIIRDPRVKEEDNGRFIDLMERYFEQPDELKEKDIKKEVFYQVGITPENTEKARDHCERVKGLGDDDKPLTICPPEADPKMRFFWRMGELPPKTEFKQLNMDPVVPEAFPEWTETMNTWGKLLLDTVHTVAEMAALGFDLPATAFTDLMKYGPHLLAPTGSNFYKYGKVGTVLASYHYDLNFLTIHGKSRFPGLYLWTREGKRYPVKVPDGCLLCQAGKQFEWLTGGHVLAGFHEVVVSDKTVETIDKAREAGRSLWRISSTLFSHIASDNTLEPLAKFATDESLKAYPPTKAGHQVRDELAAIKLAKDEVASM